MNFRNHTLLIALILGGMGLTNCKIQKHEHPNGLQTECKTTLAYKTDQEQNVVIKTEFSPSTIENVKFELKKDSSERVEVIQTQNRRDITQSSFSTLQNKGKIKEYRVYFIDGTDFIEKRERKKCYENLNSIEEEMKRHEEVATVKAASSLSPVLLPVVLISTIAVFIRMKGKGKKDSVEI